MNGRWYSAHDSLFLTVGPTIEDEDKTISGLGFEQEYFIMDTKTELPFRISKGRISKTTGYVLLFLWLVSKTTHWSLWILVEEHADAW